MWACVLICLLISSLSFHLLSKFHVCTSKIKEESKRAKVNATNESNKRRMLNMSLYSQMTKLDFNMKYSILKVIQIFNRQWGSLIYNFAKGSTTAKF